MCFAVTIPLEHQKDSDTSRRQNVVLCFGGLLDDGRCFRKWVSVSNMFYVALFPEHGECSGTKTLVFFNEYIVCGPRGGRAAWHSMWRDSKHSLNTALSVPSVIGRGSSSCTTLHYSLYRVNHQAGTAPLPAVMLAHILNERGSPCGSCWGVLLKKLFLFLSTWLLCRDQCSLIQLANPR